LRPRRKKFNLNQFGGSFGGPIRKNKTFFFIDGEQKYQRHGITFTGLVPSEAMRTGDFSSDPFGNPVSGLVIVNPNMIWGLDESGPSLRIFISSAMEQATLCPRPPTEARLPEFPVIKSQPA